jgi:hypothetical protein
VDDGLLGALERFEGAADEVLAGLGEHFDGDVVGNVAALDEAAHETEFGFRGRREGDLDFLEADGAEHLEHRIFLSAFIGSKRAWLPSRRSVLIQTGGVVMVRLGHWRSASWTGGKAAYLAAGWKSCPAPECFSDGESLGKAAGRCLRIDVV